LGSPKPGRMSLGRAAWSRARLRPRVHGWWTSRQARGEPLLICGRGVFYTPVIDEPRLLREIGRARSMVFASTFAAVATAAGAVLTAIPPFAEYLRTCRSRRGRHRKLASAYRHPRHGRTSGRGAGRHLRRSTRQSRRFPSALATWPSGTSTTGCCSPTCTGRPQSPVLGFTFAEWEAFLSGVKSGNFDAFANGDCVEAAHFTRRRISVRNRLDLEGPVLRFTPADWRVFLGGMRLGEFDGRPSYVLVPAGAEGRAAGRRRRRRGCGRCRPG
jgi:hypothetical protein